MLAVKPAGKVPRRIQAAKWRGIVKVQRSLFTTEPDGTQVLIYNEDHTVEWSGPIGRSLVGWFKADEAKFFAYAALVGTIVNIERKAPWQDW